MLKKSLSGIAIFSFLFSAHFVGAKGPTAPPNIVGPKTGIPSVVEIRKIKCTKDLDFIGSEYCSNFESKVVENKKEDEGFFGWLWSSIISLFD